MKLNAKSIKDMEICFRNSITEPPSLMINDVVIERVNSFKLLRLHIDNNRDLENTTRRQRRRENGVIFPYMDVATPFLRHFHVVFDVASCLLNLSNNNLKWNTHIDEITRKASKRLLSTIWTGSGLPQYLTDELERIQSRSLKVIGLPSD